MNDVRNEDQIALLAPMSSRQLLGAGLIGLLIGLVVWGISSIVDQYVLKLLFCQSSECVETTPYAIATASIIGAALGLFSLVKLRVLRPLLIVVAAMAALWGLSLHVAELPIYGVILANVFLYGAMYLLFAWLGRLRSIYVILGLFLAIVVVMRFVLTS
jgi:hypothetical protein